MTSKQTWYVRRGQTVKGPFPSSQVVQYIALGRIHKTDDLSQDKQTWVPVSSQPRLLQLAEKLPQQSLEERSPPDRRHDTAKPDSDKRKIANDRRQEEPVEDVERRQRRKRVLKSLREAPESKRGPLLVVALLIMGGVAAGFFLNPENSDKMKPDCNHPAGPDVNWSNCILPEMQLRKADLRNGILRNARLSRGQFFGAILENADLAYADLINSDMSYADLSGAYMKGADLKMANLSNAKLTNADMTYVDLSGAKIGGADLTGAQLTNAIWIDGRTCAAESIGKCN